MNSRRPGWNRYLGVVLMVFPGLSLAAHLLAPVQVLSGHTVAQVATARPTLPATRMPLTTEPLATIRAELTATAMVSPPATTPVPTTTTRESSPTPLTPTVESSMQTGHAPKAPPGPLPPAGQPALAPTNPILTMIALLFVSSGIAILILNRE